MSIVCLGNCLGHFFPKLGNFFQSSGHTATDALFNPIMIFPVSYLNFSTKYQILIEIVCSTHIERVWVRSNHRYRKSQNRLLKVCCVPATSAGLPRISFFFPFFVAVAIYVPLSSLYILRCLWIKYRHDFTTQWGFLDFIVLIKILFADHLKHSSF